MQYIKQDLLSIQRGVIAHGCNYVGVMGAGVAKLIRDKYPIAFEEYAKWLQTFPDRKDALGSTHFVCVDRNTLWIANCITQGLATYDGQMATPKAIGESLAKAFQAAWDLNLPLYLPKIGAGLGGLDWEQDVEPIVEGLAASFTEVDTYICVWP